MQPDPPPIPTPIPKTDPPSLRKPLRLALLRATGLALRLAMRSSVPALPDSEDVNAAGAHTRAPRILLIRPDHLGDVLFLTPALRLLRAQLPDAHLTALVGPWARVVLARNPHLDAIRTLDFPGFTRAPQASAAGGLKSPARRAPLAPYRYVWTAARALRAERYDVAVILRFDHWWGALLAALAGIPRRIGYDTPEVQPFLSEALPYERGRHEVLQNVRLIARAARCPEPTQTTPAALPLEFDPGPAATAFVDPWLRAKGIAAGAPLAPGAVHSAQESEADSHGGAGAVKPSPSRRFALLVPGSGAAVKLWREDGFARVAEALAARGLKVIVVGAGEAERALAQRIAAQSSAPLVDAAGETTFEQLAALFARAALVVGTDSGPMHLAVAMRAPTVHLFGPVSARTFGPWGDGAVVVERDAVLSEGPTRHVVLTSGLACIACNRLDYLPDELAAHPCVPLIADRQVMAAINALSSQL